MNRFMACALLVGLLAGCGDGNPFTEDDDGVVTPGDPSTDNRRFLYNESESLVANQFSYDPDANGGQGSIVINNLPFDGVTKEGGEYTRKAGAAILPDGGILFENNPGPGEDSYLAVVIESPGGTRTLVGAVGTNAYRGFGYGGAVANRPSANLPAQRPSAYIYEGPYGGIRVVRNETSGGGTIQTTTGLASLQVDILDVDGGGSAKGRIINRQVCDENGMACAPIVPIILNEGTISTTDKRVGGTADTRNIDGTTAQAGTWEGNFAGPDGAEIAGFLVVSGPVPDSDPEYIMNETVNAREVGAFIGEKQN